LELKMKMKYYLIIIVFLILYVTKIHGQGIELFQYVETDAVTLTEDQNERLDNILSREYIKEVHIVYIDDAHTIRYHHSLTLNLPDERKIITEKSEIRNRNEKSFTWSGKTVDPTATILIVVTERGITGIIQSTEYHFIIEPLGNDVHALIEAEPEKFPKEYPPIINENRENNGDGSINTHLNNASSMNMLSSVPQIDILVVYTEQAKNSSGDIDGVIFGAEDITNQSFSNSEISASINVVHTAEVNYTESGDITLDLCRLTASQSYIPSYCITNYGEHNVAGYMYEVHNWRGQYGADLVVLITAIGGLGVAWQHSNVDIAFSVVRWDVAIGNYTFAHEIGHNIGVHHDRDNDNNPHYPYGHGYRYPPGNWRTIMAYEPGIRINYWSNPRVFLGGVQMGTYEHEDNARVWNERGDCPIFS
jgi:hypothetical protein